MRMEACSPGATTTLGRRTFRFSLAGAVAIAAGYYHSLALLSDHSVVAWGLQDTVPASATNVVAIAGGWWHSLALRARIVCRLGR